MSFRFSTFELDMDRRELRRDGFAVPVEPQVLDLIAFLVNNQDRVVSQEQIFDAVWEGRVVSLSTLTSRINAARAALGDSGQSQTMIKTVPRRGYRFVGGAAPANGENLSPSEGSAPAVIRPASTQEIRFCETPDNVRIAYSTLGDGEPLVKAGNWLNHLEHDWDGPVWSHLLKWMASKWQLTRYDARGNGLSDWDVDEISFDAFVRDLESVVDAAGLETFSLFGASQGCAVSIAYAVKHPERVKKLVLYGGFALGRRLRGSPQDNELIDAMLTLMRAGWGQENPAFRQVFTSNFVPGGSAEQVDWFNNLQRITTSPANAVRIRSVSDMLDVTHLLEQVKAPTLVLHCREDAMQPFEEGRRIAARIPNSSFVGLEGKNHLILEKDEAWPRFREAVCAFLES